MPRFSYAATDAAGLASKGEVEAPDRRAAARKLAARGLSVAKLAEASGKVANVADGGEDHPALHVPRRLGVHPAAMAFIGGFAELHEGGMPVGDAVKLMATRVTEPALRALCKGLWRDLSEGMPLSMSLSKRPILFDEAVVRLVEAGEATGNLVPVLMRIRQSYERVEGMRSRLITATAYPLLLSGMGTAVLSLFVFVIMPIMENMMKQLGGKFPWYVRFLMGSSSLFVKSLPFLLVIGAIAFLRLKKARVNPEARRRQDALIIRIPLAGRAVVHAEASRLAELLSTLLGSGVNAAQALKLGERPVANTELRARFAAARRRVHDGAAISNSLRDTGIFEPEDIDLAAVGESSGTLPRAFSSISARRTKALDATITKIVRVISGVFLGLVITMVGFCMVSIITTVLSVSKSIGHH
jgi:general secretion pathway protein F